MDLDLFFPLAAASIFLFCLSILGKQLTKMVEQTKITEKQRKMFWNICAILLASIWFAFFWDF
jgi:hypothetical protein